MQIRKIKGKTAFINSILFYPLFHFKYSSFVLKNVIRKESFNYSYLEKIPGNLYKHRRVVYNNV